MRDSVIELGYIAWQPPMLKTPATPLRRANVSRAPLGGDSRRAVIGSRDRESESEVKMGKQMGLLCNPSDIQTWRLGEAKVILGYGQYTMQ